MDLNPYEGPSLFVNGSFSTDKMQKDNVFPPTEDLKNIYKPHFPDCTVVIVPEAGHFVHTDKPQQVCSLISDFLDSVDQL